MIEKPIKKISVNKTTYEEYVKQGLWKPTGNVKFNVGISGKVMVEAKIKGLVKMIPAQITITDYFYTEMYKVYKDNK